jgi:NADH-quinone oxidoreductase subunit E/NADP-reducing hydrogenase subunit HndA
LTADFKGGLEEILSSYGRGRDNLIPILQEAQEHYGYLPEEVIEEIANYMHLSGSTIYGVITFYSHFKLSPGGRQTVRVCRGTACHVRGGTRIIQDIERRLGVKAGETTTDGEYTLETVACIGACALAPTITIDKETYGDMTTKKTAEVFGDRSKEQ